MERNGFLHRLDPRSKIVAVILLSLAAFVAVKIEAVLVLLAFITALWIASGLPFHIASGYLRLVRVIGLFLIVTQSLWYPGSSVLVSPVVPRWVPLLGGTGTITAEGVYWGVLSTGRLLALLLALPLLTQTTSAGCLSLGLVRMGVPYTTSFLATAALNMVPSIKDEAESMIQAQLLRGATSLESRGIAGRLRGYVSIAVPLGVNSIRKAHLMGVAMDSRAFGCDVRRTFIRQISMKAIDWAFVLVCAAVTISVAAWSYWGPELLGVAA
ncbi:MAG: energy-coupling factor transporter transmembrane component T family protein [Ignavibacteriales bacterium]